MSTGLIVFPASLGSIFHFSIGACPVGGVCVGPSAIPVVPGHSLACIQGSLVVTPCPRSLVVGAGRVLVCVTLGAWHRPWGVLWGLPTPLALVLKMLTVSAWGQLSLVSWCPRTHVAHLPVLQLRGLHTRGHPLHLG